MTLDNLAALLEALENASLSFDSVANCLRFLQNYDGRSVTVRSVAEVTDRPVETIEPLLYRLDRAGVLQSKQMDVKYFSLEEGRMEQLDYVLDWLTEFYDHQTLEAMADLRVNDLMALYTVPAGADMGQRSNMTGQLLDMTSNADEMVSVVVPFFSDAGVDTISESLAAATDRDVSVELLTRDLTMGNELNQSYIRSICAKIRAEGTPR